MDTDVLEKPAPQAETPTLNLPKMNPEVKAKWLEALRSGEYNQGRNKLRTAEGLCCLGVLCEIAIKDGVLKPYDVVVFEESGIHHYGGEDCYPPESVIDWSGLANRGIYRDGNGEYLLSLGSLNDGDESDLRWMSFEVKEYSFSEIADIIEREL
jgi:hypothetical protein